jgi:glycosyltransferase involved in cell wall biosynthesis
MKISGFTIVRNAIQFNYPVLESIHSILPICDEFIVNVGDSDDQTLKLIESIPSKKIRIIQNRWDFSMGKEVLKHQTNLALKACSGDWAFYLQSDEVIHEQDLPRLRLLMAKKLTDLSVDALRFRWLHFYGSYFRYRIDQGWYQKQDRIIRNNGTVRSYGDAYAFERVDQKPLRTYNTNCFLYHYGWVHPQDIMASRRQNAELIGFVTRNEKEKKSRYDYGDLNRFPVYFGSHPMVMKERIAIHEMSCEDKASINRRYWWHPFKILKLRHKTGKRVKEKIE